MKTRAVYVALAIDIEGDKKVLGLWIAPTEGAVSWLTIFGELKARGMEDCFIACVDGLKGLPEAIETVFPHARVQLCVVHQVACATCPGRSASRWRRLCARSTQRRAKRPLLRRSRLSRDNGARSTRLSLRSGGRTGSVWRLSSTTVLIFLLSQVCPIFSQNCYPCMRFLIWSLDSYSFLQPKTALKFLLSQACQIFTGDYRSASWFLAWPPDSCMSSSTAPRRSALIA